MTVRGTDEQLAPLLLQQKPRALGGDDADKLSSASTTAAAAAAGPKEADSSDDSVDPNELWYLHGKAYDLRDFVDKHPGGRDALISTQGRDCTALFESYHAFVDRPHLILASLKEVKLSPEVLKSRVTDVSERGWFRLADGVTVDPFWKALKERCRKKLEELGTPRTMPWGDFLYCLSLFTGIVTVYTFGFCSFNWGVATASAPVMGVLCWLIARLGHDGSHFSVSRRPWVNRVSGVIGSMMVTNPFYWLLLHTVAHHSDTNQPNDPDLYHFEVVMRMSADSPKSFLHNFQKHKLWVYGWWLNTVYGLTTEEPLKMMIVGTGTAPYPGVRLTKNRPWFWVCMVTHLVGFWGFGLVLPYYLKSSSTSLSKPQLFLAQMGIQVLRMAVSSFLFALFSQVNHFTEGRVANSAKHTSWAVQQVETACDFCPDSLLWDLLSSGINIQIEHHLFPSLSAQRLRALVPIVREVCREFKVDHQCFDSMPACLASFHRALDILAYDVPSTKDVAAGAPPTKDNKAATVKKGEAEETPKALDQ